MHIESEKNRGTKVHIFLRLPIGLASDLPTRAEVHTDPEILRNKKILLVEDNPLNRLVVRTVLKIHGIAITEANNGQEAIDQMTSNRFDLILMDVQMPMMDGITATKIIRSEISGDIPIIALTANALRSELDHCIAAGMNDFVTKPFDETTLIRVLLNYLQ